HEHVKGVLSMANTGTPNSAGSQFFVMHGNAPHLDGHYTAFGHLISGMDVLDKIANSPTGPNPSMPGENSKPMEWTVLKSVKIMSKSAYQAMAKPAVKKTEAAKPAEGKPAETKSSMGGGGMDMGAGQSTPSSSGQSQGSTSSSNQASGHPGHDTVEKAKDATQPTTPPSSENQGGGESGN
ncbi:MAG TPA: peptidylprolyl isomerase, partial [Candidatus Dormibacteraeota bacterium]|nr:peptidylprolyl isomerase [Candidatus Dormibacteraeota bacterium]